MIKVDYPMVYAVKPILSSEWRNYGKPLGYAVVNSYLISEIKRYNSDGTFRKIYEVVHSWNEDGREDIIPQFNRDTALDSNYVDIVFTSLEEAINYRMISNNLLLEKNLSDDNITNIDYVRTSVERNFDYVLKLEEMHLSKSKVKSKLI